MMSLRSDHPLVGSHHHTAARQPSHEQMTKSTAQGVVPHAPARHGEHFAANVFVADRL
jgi:hypothetical protein